MDNNTYEGFDLTPVSTDETYSRLRTTPTNNRPRYEPQRRAENNESAAKGVTDIDTKDSQNSTKFNVVLNTVIIVVLLLLMIMSIALSVTIYIRLTSEQSQLLGQIDSTSDKISVLMDIITSQYNTSQNDIKLVQMQLTATQTNISNHLTQHDDRISDSILSVLHTQLHCGPGPWYRVAYMNMSNPTEQCPSTWKEYNGNRARACGRPASSSGSCPATPYFTCNQYSRVCGRIIGYQLASPDAFMSSNNQSVDGVIITHGSQHIWSYVAGITEHSAANACPCSNTNGQPQDVGPPESIGDNYYCESGNSGSGFRRRHLYQDDKLWDGQQCEGTCCTGTNSPPWFSVQLPTPTTDTIYVHICCDQGTDDENIPVELIEIYVQ